MGSLLIPITSTHRPAWGDLSFRFSDQKACIASYLALEAAEVLDGVKPANLVSIPNRRRSCGRNLYRIWKQWGESVLNGTGFAVRELIDRGDSILLLLFSRHALEEVLKRPSVPVILRKAGYRETGDLDTVLAEMTARISGSTFPHEIGVFLGYPLKDVVAFMGLAAIPFSCQGPWKIYGEPRESLRLAERFRCCRVAMAERLAAGTSPFACLDRTYREEEPVSRTVIENDYLFPVKPCASH